MSYSVGRGWWPLLDEYISKLESKGARLTSPPYEKYGTLRLDVDYENAEILDLLAEMEEKSSHICEFCGNVGIEKEHNGWVKTLCSICTN